MNPITCCKDGYRRLISFGTALQSPLLLLLRLFWGVMFFIAGFSKIQNISTVADYFASAHIPLPVLSAYLVAYIEAIGGICFVLGLFSRLAAIPLIIVMIVAMFVGHGDALFNKWEGVRTLIEQPPFTYLMASLIILAFGPGRYSVDSLFCGKQKTS